MIFRPKIFISSTFRENEKVREQIRKYFYSVGAEPLLYEYELTPSINPMTYRINLLDADFMILIIKDDYGTKTNTGLSGTHEEYRIAFNNQIPLHVYLKKNSSSELDKDKKKFIKELEENGISYYYFNSDSDLLKRLKETTFTIAKEIMLNDITNSKIPKESIIKLAGNSDYDRAMQIITIIESMKNVAKIHEIDLIRSTIFTDCLERIIYEFSSVRHYFINWKLDETLNNILQIADVYIDHSVKDFTATSNSREYNIKILNTINVNNLSYHRCSDWQISDYEKSLDTFFNEYEKFKEIVKNIRTEIDIL